MLLWWTDILPDRKIGLREVGFTIGMGVLATGFVVSALVGIAALYLVVYLLYQVRFRYFSYYVWTLGLVIFLIHI